MKPESSMRIASCPRCGKPRPAFDGKTVSCQRCRQTTQFSTATTTFLEKASALWLNAEVTLRTKRAADLILQHDAWLRERGDYDIITATLDENWVANEGAGYINDDEPSGEI
jgi:hypothetical protein